MLLRKRGKPATDRSPPATPSLGSATARAVKVVLRSVELAYQRTPRVGRPVPQWSVQCLGYCLALLRRHGHDLRDDESERGRLPEGLRATRPLDTAERLASSRVRRLRLDRPDHYAARAGALDHAVGTRR